MIAADGYVHYWFSSSEMEIRQFNDAKRNEILNDLNNQFQQRKKQMVSATDEKSKKEAGALIDFLTYSKEAAEERKAVFEQETNAYSGGWESGLGEYTFGQLRNKSSEEIVQMVNDLANGITDFTDHLENLLQNIYESVCKDGAPAFEQYKENIVKEYINNKGLKGDDNSEIAKAIWSDLLSSKHNGLNRYNSTQKDFSGTEGLPKVATALKNLTLIAEALPQLNNKDIKFNAYDYKKQVTASEVLNIIAGKMAGMFSNIKGAGGEIAAKRAEESVLKKVAEGIFEAQGTKPSIQSSKVTTVGDSVEKREIYDPQLIEDASKEEKIIRVSKSDVDVTLTMDGVKITYGINVKNYTPPSKDVNMEAVSLESKANLLDVAQRNGINLYYMFNIAAGHPDSNFNKQYHANRSIKRTYTDEELSKGWFDLISYTVYKHFLTAIAGEIINNSKSILFFSLNGQVFPIDEVIEKVRGQNEMDLTYRLTQIRAISTRDSFVKSNKWDDGDERKWAPDPEKAKKRGHEAWESVRNVLNDTKLSIDLKVIASLMK